MTKLVQKPINHGRDHAPGGADPIPGLSGGGGARQLGVGWSGPYPLSVLTGAVWKVPLVDGASVTFDLSRLLFRLEQPGTGTTTVRVEKASGGDVAFSPTTVTTLSLTGGSDYENSTTSSLGSVSSGDLLRIVWTAVGMNARGYLVMLEGAEA